MTADHTPDPSAARAPSAPVPSTPENGAAVAGPSTTGLAPRMAARLRAERDALVRRWLDRIVARVTIAPERIFPTDALLNHVPLLIDGIADYLEGPARTLDADVPVTAKAMELGALRHAQGFDAYEILKEHEILGNVVLSFLAAEVDGLAAGAPPREVAACWQRVSHATELIRQATLTHFLRLSAERVHEREARLRRFNRMVAHELKNRVGAIRGAAGLLPEPWLDDTQRLRFTRMIAENAQGLQQVLDNLEALSRLDADARQQRNVLLAQTVAEVVRQLRAVAEARGVTVRVADDLPTVEVDAAAVELCLTNYLSNAIKYADPAAPERWVEVSGALRFGVPPDGGGELVVRVADNGLGVPPDARGQLFDQFYRAHGETVTGVEGTGLGLSIVRETVEALGGHAWVEFPRPQGSVFAFSLPSRRAEDAAAAGTKRVESVAP
jgi:signal transduction histidine kinase